MRAGDRSSPPARSARGARGAPFPPRLGLGIAILAISWAAILIRLAGAPPLATGAWRLALASLLFWAGLLLVRGPAGTGWTGARAWTAVAAAPCLAAHFGLWIASLGSTSVASSTLLVSTQPVFVALLGRLFLRERVEARAGAGIALALAGTAAITGGDLRSSGSAWAGDLLALGGALAIAVYYLLVRRLRAHVGLLALMSAVTPLAAALLFLAAAVRGEALAGFPARTYALFFLLALGPTAVGHTLLNWALRYMKAYEVNVATLGEPIGATLLAFLVFGERPGLHVLAGGALVLAGIGLAWSRSAPAPAIARGP